VRLNGPAASARIAIVLLLIMITLVTPESAQLLLACGLAALAAGDIWWERRAVRRLALAVTGFPAGRHREIKQRTRALLR
jgi:hypothetical protein